MENNIVMNDLSNLTKDVLYFSESENPFTVSNWGQVPQAGLAGKIATEHTADASLLRVIDAKSFFENLIAKADPADQPMVENAKKIRALYDYVQKHLSNLQVTRAEGATRIPIVINGYLPNGDCIAIQTQAVET